MKKYIIFFLLYFFIPAVALAGVTTSFCSGLPASADVYLDFKISNSVNQTATMMTSSETRSFYALSSPSFYIRMRGQSDPSGNAYVRVYTSTGTPSVSGLVCSVVPIDSISQEQSRIASLMLGGFAAIAFVLAISARFRGRG